MYEGTAFKVKLKNETTMYSSLIEQKSGSHIFLIIYVKQALETYNQKGNMYMSLYTISHFIL